jgi:bactofilin
MSFSNTESDVIADKSFLSKTAGTDSPEFNLLSETNQSFQDRLEDLSIPEAPPVDSQHLNAPNYLPKPPREISFEGTLKVNGYLAGVVCSPDGTLILGERGEIDSDIFVKVAVIHGSVRGDIHATRKVELGSTSRVIGDIETPELAIQPGAVFEGRCAFPPRATDEQPDLSVAVTN